MDADAGQAALEVFDEKWGQRCPVITQAWLNAWEYVAWAAMLREPSTLEELQVVGGQKLRKAPESLAAASSLSVAHRTA